MLFLYIDYSFLKLDCICHLFLKILIALSQHAQKLYI